MNNELLDFYYRVGKLHSSLCLFGRLECKKNGIKAHSVQNSFVFDILSDNGHLIAIKNHKDENHKPIVKWDKIGRNLASTFTGLCKEHNNDLFKAIDINPVDVDNPQHLFLLAYRSVFKELHENIASGSKLNQYTVN